MLLKGAVRDDEFCSVFETVTNRSLVMGVVKRYVAGFKQNNG